MNAYYLASQYISALLLQNTTLLFTLNKGHNIALLQSGCGGTNRLLATIATASTDDTHCHTTIN